MGVVDVFYTSILKGELNNRIQIESKGKRIYLFYESVTAIEEL